MQTANTPMDVGSRREEGREEQEVMWTGLLGERIWNSCKADFKLLILETDLILVKQS